WTARSASIWVSRIWRFSLLAIKPTPETARALEAETRVNGFIGFLEKLFAGFGLQGARGFGRRLDRQEREPKHFQAERGDFFRRGKFFFHLLHDARGGPDG